MSDGVVIEVEGLRAFGRHGALASEREQGQPFLVDLRLTPTAARAVETDDLADAVDYGAVCDRVVELVTGEPDRLLERLADRIARDLLERFPLDRAHVRVRKPHAPIRHPFEWVAVSVERSRPSP